MERLSSGETASIQNLVSMIVDPDGKGLEDHWAKTAHSLIVGCITHLLYVGKREGRTPCLADVVAELTKPGIPWRANISQWQQFPHLGFTEFGASVHPVVNNAAQEMLNRDDREASSVLSTTVAYLTLYRDPVIAKNTSRSSFHIKDLMNHERPMSRTSSSNLWIKTGFGLSSGCSSRRSSAVWRTQWSSRMANRSGRTNTGCY